MDKLVGFDKVGRIEFCKKLFLFFSIIVFTQVAFTSFAYPQKSEKFIYFTDIDGLPRNIVTCLEQDKYGYLWIGTPNGIARYDGNSFSSFDQMKEKSIQALCVDKNNKLWVGTSSGLYSYNRSTNHFELKSEGFFKRIEENEGDIYTLQIGKIQKITEKGITEIVSNPDLSDFCVTSEGIWFSSKNEGVKLLSRESGFHEIQEQQLNGQLVWVIREIDARIFLGCRNGELFVRSVNGNLKRIAIENHHNIKSITKVKDEIWIATDGNGIVVLDTNLNYSRTITRNQNQATSISSNSIYDMLPGQNGEIWIASYGAGLTCILPDNLLFQNIAPEKGNNNSLIANEGTAVFEKKGTFYFGTNYGLSVWNERLNQYTNLSVVKLKNELKGSKILAVCTDKDNSIWIGTYDGLLGKYNPDFQLIKIFNPSGNIPAEMQQIVLMHNYNDQNLLIGTHYQDRGLLNLDFKTETLVPFELQLGEYKTKNFQVNSIRKNQQGELIASIFNQGLFKVNVKDNSLENSFSELNKRIHFPNTDFYHDKDGFYWFTSSTNGLNRISADGSQFDQWTEKEGLPTNSLLRIESVDDQYLWISSIAGICRFDRKTKQVMNFNHRDGLAANEFFDFVSSKTADGKIIFGSVAGFTIVNPDKVTPDTSKSEVIISDITFQNQSIRNHEGKQILTAPLEETKKIELPYSRNSFTIHFFTRNKDFAKYNNYNYRLVGLESGWIYLGEMNRINYTNLSPGTYTFEVKSSSKSDIGNSQPTQLTIRILPPWYLSWYAIILYTILVFSLIFGVFTIYDNRVQLKKEKEISEYKIKKEHELTEKKLSFFTNISHDLKTPLTLIIAPVNDLLESKDLDPDQINKLSIIRRNSMRLYKLITDLLDFRKLTQKQLSLEVSETNISELIDNIYLAFQEGCKNKSISFEKKILIDHPVFVDAPKIEKIIWNLLSNAVKFTPQNGEIYLGAEEKNIGGEKCLELVVMDNGIGISEQDRDKIFDAFYQVKTPQTIAIQGTGIGLSIVKDMVELHHGEIQLESSPGKGSTFRVILPAGKEQYSTSEISLVKETTSTSASFEVISTDELASDQKTKQYNLPKILVVEDNPELREYLLDHFKTSYKVYEAEDGMIGLTVAREINPDIILTDVQMPNMNGYDFCQEIRQQFDTSHIPVVMLTANSAVEQQIEGLNTGADAYMTKPFDIKLLDVLLNTVLENRRRLRYKFLRLDSSLENENQFPSKDLDFISELKVFIEENIANQQLNIDLIAKHFTISQTQLNRKTKSLTGLTPNNLIKTIRLKKAYQLIREKGMRVSEAAYQTGFTDPNYFTTCFKKEFGENPSQIGMD